MELSINKHWRVTTSAMNFNLEQYVTVERKADGQDDETGETWKKGDKSEKWQNAGYFSSLEGALACYTRERMKASDAKTLSQVSALLAEIRGEIAKVAEALKPAVGA